MHRQFFQLVPFALVAALAMAQHQNDAAPGSGCRGTRSTWSLVATQWWGMLMVGMGMMGTVDAGMVGVSCKPPFLCKWAMSETWDYQPMSHNIAYARPYACLSLACAWHMTGWLDLHAPGQSQHALSVSVEVVEAAVEEVLAPVESPDKEAPPPRRPDWSPGKCPCHFKEDTLPKRFRHLVGCWRKPS